MLSSCRYAKAGATVPTQRQTQQQQQPRGSKRSNRRAANSNAGTAAASNGDIAAQMMPPPPPPQATTPTNGRVRIITAINPLPAAAAAAASSSQSDSGAAGSLPPPPPPAVAHRRSTLRSHHKRDGGIHAPQTPYNTTAYILSHPPPSARPASSPDRYGSQVVDMPEIDQWKGYGSMEKGVGRLRRGGQTLGAAGKDGRTGGRR